MKYRVLIAEDEASSAMLLSRMVKRLGHDPVAIVETAQAALEFCERDRPDIVLMDVTFKSTETQGPEAGLQLYERYTIPVIFVSSIEDERMYSIVVEAKAFGYIVKPPEPHQLRLALELAFNRSLMERKLRDSQGQFAAALRSSLDAVVTIDAHGNIVEFNPAAESIFGWLRAEVMHKSMADIIIPPAYKQAHLAGLRHYFETGEGPVLGKRIEIEAARRSGEIFPVELAINTFTVDNEKFFTAYVRDITDRKQQEAVINQRDRLLSGAARATDVLLQSPNFDEAIKLVLKILGEAINAEEIMIFTTETGSVSTRNYQPAYLWQAESGDKHIRPKTSQGELQALIQTHSEALSQGQAIELNNSDQTAAVAKGGGAELATLLAPFNINYRNAGVLVFGFHQLARSWNSSETEILHALAGSVGGAMSRRKTLEELQASRRSLQEKVHELKQRELELQQTMALLVRREKLANLGSIAGMIAHEINSPLGAIINSAERLIDRQNLTAAHRRNSELILKAGARCQSVVSKFLQSVRPASESNRCSLGTVLEDWFELYGKHFQHLGIDVQATRRDGCDVSIDYTECSQILTNLMFNARDAMLDAGVSKPRVEVSLTCNEHVGVIEVTDNGPGFSEAMLSKALDPFVSSKEEGKGTGLGLYIVQNIVVNAEGSLKYGNHENGALVRTELPRVVLREEDGTKHAE